MSALFSNDNLARNCQRGTAVPPWTAEDGPLQATTLPPPFAQPDLIDAPHVTIAVLALGQANEAVFLQGGKCRRLETAVPRVRPEEGPPVTDQDLELDKGFGLGLRKPINSNGTRLT